MANISFLLVLVALSFSSLTFAIVPSSSPSPSPSKDLIDDVCSTYALPGPSFCSKVLHSDPRTRGADLLGLGRVAIDIAHRNGKSALQLVQTLGKQATDPKLKETYNSCTEQYDEAMTHLSDAMTDLNSGNYIGLTIHAYNAANFADECDNNFFDSHYHSNEPPQLSQASGQFQGVCSIILDISSKFQEALN